MKISLLLHLDVIKFVRYNFFSKKVVRHGKGYLLPYKNAVIDLGRNSKIDIYDGHLWVNNNKPKGSHAEAYLKILGNGHLIVRNTTNLNYNATIEIHNGAEVDIGSAYINTGAVILAAKSIKIGEDCLISRHVFIYDSDHHRILNENGEQANSAREVVIGNHVWIGLKCTVLRGADIGEGCMIAAGSVVGGRIRPGLMAQGNPARGYSEVTWEK
jgi:acetyltransferase-like isoleucine patch superfamily enzyme